MATPKRCPYVGLMGLRCIYVAGDGHEDTGHLTDVTGLYKTPAAWRRAWEGGRFRRPRPARTSLLVDGKNP